MGEKKLVPRRRFDGFEDEWRKLELGDVAESFEYGLNAAAINFDGENKYIRITDIDDKTRLFNQNELRSPKTDLSTAKDYLLQKGDILFARTGASVGKTYRYKNCDGKVYYAGFLIRARIKSEYDSEFIFQNTLTRKYDSYVKITSQRSGQPGVNAEEYASYQFNIPNLKEQQKIGQFFKHLDEMIALQQKKIDKTLGLKSAYLAEMFPAEGERVPKRRFEGFTDEWEKYILKDLIVSEEKGRARADMIGDESIYLDTSYLNGGEAFFVDSPSNVEEDDILILWDGSHAGKVYHGFNGALGSTLKSLKPIESGSFIYYYLYFNQKKIFEQYRTPNIPHVINTFTDEFVICKPSIEEQLKISEFFKKLDDIIANHQQKLEKLKVTKQAYLNEMFV